jgi:hypothetical protein
MSQSRVVVVEDQAAHLDYVRSKLPAPEFTVDLFSTIGELDRAAQRGEEWDVAFVDFHLAPDCTTGLTALKILHDYAAVSKTVAYTTFGENSRVLYAVAARRWFDVTAVLDKGDPDPGRLASFTKRLLEGEDPSQPGWRERLRHADVMDQLLPEPQWLRTWRSWCRQHGDRRAVATETGLSASALRKFSEDAIKAIDSFERRFGGEDAVLTDHRASRGNVQRIGPINRFVERNSFFFFAPDLDKVIKWPQQSSKRRQRPAPSH